MPRARYFAHKTLIRNGPHTMDHSGGQGRTATKPQQKHKNRPGKVPQAGTEPNPPNGGRFVLRKLGRRMEWRKR